MGVIPGTTQPVAMKSTGGDGSWRPRASPDSRRAVRAQLSTGRSCDRALDSDAAEAISPSPALGTWPNEIEGDLRD